MSNQTSALVTVMATQAVANINKSLALALLVSGGDAHKSFALDVLRTAMASLAYAGGPEELRRAVTSELNAMLTVLSPEGTRPAPGRPMLSLVSNPQQAPKTLGDNENAGSAKPVAD